MNSPPYFATSTTLIALEGLRVAYPRDGVDGARLMLVYRDEHPYPVPFASAEARDATFSELQVLLTTPVPALPAGLLHALVGERGPYDV